jgi:hypothetical protein
MIEPTENPAWPTTLRSRLRDGRLMGVDGSVWLYMKVPMAPVVDAKNQAEAIVAAEPLLAAYEELASITNYSMARRSMAKGNYRQTHLLLVNIPRRFEPDRAHPLAEYLRQQYPNTPTDRRILLLGVKLRGNVGGTGGLRAAIDSVVETLVAGGTPLSDYDQDFSRVRGALERAGLVMPSAEDIRLANAWWNHGDYPDTPTLVHADHLHFFNSAEAVTIADRVGVENCHQWNEKGVPGQHAVTFASVQDLELPFIDIESPLASWVSDLLALGALTVSVRGNIEPANITRDELRRQRKRYIDDINERAQSGKMERAEQEEMLHLLGQVEGMYATGTASPTIAGASVVVGFDGQIGDIQQLIPAHVPAKLSVMSYRQPGALAETMLCSNLNANPNLHDFPTQVIACSGVPSLNLVGDRSGVLLGFTERDRQPAYLSPAAASAEDQAPLMIVAGQTGAGKSVLMQMMADQAARAGTPTIIWDPKQTSDFSPVALASGGQVYSLDRLLEADGVFDPIRFAPSAEVGVELAASVLMSINPWGTMKADMEVPLTNALAFGVRNGAKCIGQALSIAKQGLPNLPPGLVERVEELATASSQFRAVVGINPQGQSISAATGITLIKVGNATLDLPQPGSQPDSIYQRISLALVRMVVFGSAMALAQKDGMLLLDEAWIVLQAGRSEVERLGRLARSQRVLPVLFTQRVTDATNAGLSGYISRGMILPIQDPEEARSACDLFKLEATPERMARLTAKDKLGGNSNDGVALNWNSMRALRDPRTGRVLRGTIGIYCDLAGRAIPIEVTIPPELLALASTNPEDIRRRDEAAKAKAAQLHKAAQAAGQDPGPDTGGAVIDGVFGQG